MSATMLALTEDGQILNADELTQALRGRVVVGEEGECWPFAGCLTEKGYGITSIGGRRMRAHRAAYALCYGEIPAGMLVCHRCDNPRCCNPHHLFLGSAKDNTADMVAKGRHYCRRAERHPRAKVTSEIVVAMRVAYWSGEANTPQLAKRYGISISQAGHIVTGRNWKNAGGPLAPTAKASELPGASITVRAGKGGAR